MKIIRNYILKDFFVSLFLSLLIFNLVMLLGNMMQLSDMVIRKGVHILDALKIIAFLMPVLLTYTLPLAFLLGVLLTTGRLIADNEIIAIRVAGISLMKILNVFLVIGIVFSLFLFLLNDRVIPNFHYLYRNKVKNIYSKNISALIEPGIFMENFKNHIMYVSDRDGHNLKDIIIYELDNTGKMSKETTAKTGKFITDNGMLKMQLEDVFYHEVDPSGAKELRGTFKVFFKDIPIDTKNPVEIERKPCNMRLTEIRDKINQLKTRGIDNPIRYTSEFNKRVSWSFSILVFIILGFGSALLVRHREKSINLGVAFFAAGFYYLLFILGEALIEYKFISPVLGMWMPNILFGSLGGFLIYKYAYRR
ncbi:MAG: LptF/LptG family permease [Candidatus Omnitrophota bacterium]